MKNIVRKLLSPKTKNSKSCYSDMWMKGSLGIFEHKAFFRTTIPHRNLVTG